MVEYFAMQALVLTEYGKLEVLQRDDPVPADNEVLVSIRSVGICGSDVHGYDGSSGRRIPPIIMGHEASGVITAVGEKVGGWRIGDRVTFDSTVYQTDDWYSMRGQYNLSDGREVVGVSPGPYRRDGAFAQLLTLPHHILYRIPDGVSFDQAAMVEPFGVSAHALSLAPGVLGEAVAVVGCGTIGLAAIQLALAAGAHPVFGIDPEPSRREAAAASGADPLDPTEIEVIREHTDGRGADVAIEAVGSSPALATAIDSVRRGASVIIIGNIAAEATIPLQKIVTEQICLQGSCAITGEYEQVLALMQAGKIDVGPLLSAHGALEEAPRWFERLHAREPGLIKVMLHPNGVR